MSRLKGSQHLKIKFTEIEVATKNFETCIGKGGYGQVYKGELSVSGKHTMVAIKRLNENLGQGSKEFLTEIHLLSDQTHPNLISLLGYCDEEKEKIIVYEYAERGSLDRYLSRSDTKYTLMWLERLKICVDAARGLEHLHSHVGKHQTIIHRDVKSANILIDENWVAKVSDLGLSKLSIAGLGRSAVISHACGTPGYCEPEYIITGVVKKESDVYSFGMVLFEVLCGRLCTVRDDDGLLLSAKFVKDHYENNKLDEIVDPSLLEQMSASSMNKFSEIAYRCLHDKREERPPMYLVRKEIEELLNIQVENEFEKEIGTMPHGELFALLHKGIIFDESNKLTWINDHGKKCLMISARRCVNSKEKYLTWVFLPDSRFKMVAKYPSLDFLYIQCQIKARMLSYGTIYTASLVFKYQEQHIADLNPSKLTTIKWKTRELSVCSTHTAELTSDNWYRIKMWNFIHHRLNEDFDIVVEDIFYPHEPYIHKHGLMFQGIQFQPADMDLNLQPFGWGASQTTNGTIGIQALRHWRMEHEEIQALRNPSTVNEDNINNDEYWEKKLPQNYQHFVKVSDKPMHYVTKKRLYSLMCTGFHGDKGKLWFSLCQSTGGICSMLSAIDILRNNFFNSPTLAHSESRFKEVKTLKSRKWHKFTCRLRRPMFSPLCWYAIYLVFKFADSQIQLGDARLWKIWYALDDIHQGVLIAHLNSPPPMNIPTIKSKNEYGSPGSSNIPKVKEVKIPKGSIEYEGHSWMEQRTDGWMEVMLCNKLHRLEHHYSLKVEMYSKIGPLHEIIVEGIEFRPVKKCI